MTHKPLILAVETSGRIGSVAIALGRQLLAESTFTTPMRHSAELFGAIYSLLGRFARKPREIAQIHISIGPGSFTGLRIAVTLAKIMHLATAAKIVAVDTLDVIAANAANYVGQTTADLRNIATILDAKRGQFYVAAYQRSRHRRGANKTEHPLSTIENQVRGAAIWTKIFPDSVMSADQFSDCFAGTAEPIWLLGEGLVYHQDRFRAEGIRFFDEHYWYPKASNVHLLGYDMSLKGQFADPLTLTPKYLLRPDIKIKRR